MGESYDMTNTTHINIILQGNIVYNNKILLAYNSWHMAHELPPLLFPKQKTQWHVT